MSKTRQGLIIRLRYLTAGSKRARTIVLTEDEYFDPEYKLVRKDKISSVPRHQEGWRYIQEQGPIIGTTVTLIDARLKQRRTLTTSYWNNMESHLTEVREYGIDDTPSRELISSQKLEIAGMMGWLIERWSWVRGHWMPSSCSFVEQLADGAQRDHPIDVRHDGDLACIRASKRPGK